MLAAFEHSDFGTGELLALRRETVSVCIPTRQVAARIDRTIAELLPLVAEGLVDELLVVDADSSDGTAQIAREAGAKVVSENELMPEFGPCRGKGDAMWRALSHARGELVVFVDGDIADIGPHYITGLLGPLLTRPELSFVKGFYQRPFAVGDREQASGGGRVTELTAKPLLELLAPDLAGFKQPLAGEFAGRRRLFEAIPFLTGYGVEIAMLVDVWAQVGLDAMAQVNLGTKRNAHQDLADLAQMARQVVEGLTLSLDRKSNSALGAIRPAPGHVPALEARPPMRQALSASKDRRR